MDTKYHYTDDSILIKSLHGDTIMPSIKSCMLVWSLDTLHLHPHQHDLQASQTQSSKALSKLKKFSKAYQVLCLVAWYYLWEFELCNWIYTNTNFLCWASKFVNLHSCTPRPLITRWKILLAWKAILVSTNISYAERESRVSLTEITGETVDRWEQQTSPGARTGTHLV